MRRRKLSLRPSRTLRQSTSRGNSATGFSEKSQSKGPCLVPHRSSLHQALASRQSPSDLLNPRCSSKCRASCSSPSERPPQRHAHPSPSPRQAKSEGEDLGSRPPTRLARSRGNRSWSSTLRARSGCSIPCSSAEDCWCSPNLLLPLPQTRAKSQSGQAARGWARIRRAREAEEAGPPDQVGP